MVHILYKVNKMGEIILKHFAILRLLMACFLLYIALSHIELSSLSATLFWGTWLGFCWLVAGANFATVLTLTRPPVMEQEEVGQHKTSTRLNSSHVAISYAVFCLKKKNKGIRG